MEHCTCQVMVVLLNELIKDKGSSSVQISLIDVYPCNIGAYIHWPRHMTCNKLVLPVRNFTRFHIIYFYVKRILWIPGF